MSADLSSHAPLLARLRGQAFLPGVHYATQAQSWMVEAADEIEALNGIVAELLAECEQLRADLEPWTDATL